MFKKILLMLITCPILASEEKPKPTYLDLVRNCPGLESISRQEAATKSFSSSETYRCPALLDLLKHSLTPDEKKLGFEIAGYLGLREKTFKELFFSGSGCNKWIDGSRRSSTDLIRLCNIDREVAKTFAKKYCETKTRK